MSDTDNQWEKDIISKLATASLNEQKKSRRWGIFFKLLTFAYITSILYLYTDPSLTSVNVNQQHTALIHLKGVIAENKAASADNIVTALRDAFDDKNTAGIIIKINSPGGSPVQAGYIYDEIVRLKKEHPDTPLYAVISDICASGGYYVASAADKIYADKASIVGSIGVRMDNFGFVDAMKKIGVERRTLTAGKNKALMDPFLPVNEKSQSHLKSMLDEIHQQFISAVKKGRGDRLKEVDGLFSGLIWTGERSVEIGLVDELASTSYVAREIIGEEDIVDFTVKKDFLERLAGRVGTSAANAFSEHLMNFNLD